MDDFGTIINPMIVAGQVQQPVQGIEQHFLLHLEPVTRRPIPCHGGADENFPVGKGDHIGLGRLAEEVPVHPGHGRAIDQDEMNRGGGKIRR